MGAATQPDLRVHLDKDIDRLVLAVVRFVLVALSSGRSEPMTAGLRACVALLGPSQGPALFNRAAALAGTIHRDRKRVLHIRPAPSECVTNDELALIDLWRLARAQDSRHLLAAAREFTDREDPHEVIAALIEVVACADAVSAETEARVLH
jgi:hypothetical protein